MPGKHSAATVTVANANIQSDVLCPDGSTYTLNIPLQVNQKYSFAANSNAPQPSPIAYQGSTANPGCSTGGRGRAINNYLTVVGVQDGFAGDGAGPGFITTDTTDSLNVTYQTKDATTGRGSPLKPTVTVNLFPLNYPAPPLPQQF
jgi:hypothetical protein